MYSNLILSDCIDAMKTLDSESIDMVLTSPPYDSLRTYKESLEWDLDIFERVADELYRVIKDGGVIVWIVNDATIKGSETGTSFKQALYFKEIGLRLHDTMIWYKTNPVPHETGRRYQPSFEYMFVLSKNRPKTFNPLMVTAKCYGKVKPRPTIETFREKDGSFKKRSHSLIANKPLKFRHNVWSNAVASTKINHPAIFPEQLVHDHIVSWSNEDDIVLDPFMGSGTTGVVCKRLNRNFIGIEKVEEYYNFAKDRIESCLK